jgi:hypothetical protein
MLQSAGAVAMFHLVPRHVLGGAGFVAPSEVITRGTIGVGGQGFRSMLENKASEQIRQVAVCDVDQNHLAKAMKNAENRAKPTAIFANSSSRKISTPFTSPRQTTGTSRRLPTPCLQASMCISKNP